VDDEPRVCSRPAGGGRIDRPEPAWYKDPSSIRARGAAWLAHWTVNPEVAGSIPVEPAKYNNKLGEGAAFAAPFTLPRLGYKSAGREFSVSTPVWSLISPSRVPFPWSTLRVAFFLHAACVSRRHHIRLHENRRDRDQPTVHVLAGVVVVLELDDGCRGSGPRRGARGEQQGQSDWEGRATHRGPETLPDGQGETHSKPLFPA
jgi:hypothetical protein